MGRVGHPFLTRQDRISTHVFRLNRLYIDDLEKVPAMDKLSEVLQAVDLVPVMVDALQVRYFDIYCVFGQEPSTEDESEE